MKPLLSNSLRKLCSQTLCSAALLAAVMPTDTGMWSFTVVCGTVVVWWCNA